MIKVTVCKENDKIASITAIGHSGYSEAGTDIICSAVSAILQTAILGLEDKLTEKSFTYTIKLSNGRKPITQIVLNKDLSAQDVIISSIILDSAILGIKSISEQYSRYVSLEVK